MQRRVFNIVWVFYFTICLLAFIWPIAGFVNTVEPTIGGFPFIFAWFILWVELIFVGSVTMYLWDKKLNRGVTQHG